MNRLEQLYANALDEYINQLRTGNRRYTHIISFDPGGTTGIAVMRLDDVGITWTTNVKYDGDMLKLITSLESYLKTDDKISICPLVIIENFRARAGRAIATTGFINVPERIIGSVQTICMLRNLDCFLVEPDEHKSYVTKAKTKVFHEHYGIRQPKVVHEKDALTILHYGLYKFSR